MRKTELPPVEAIEAVLAKKYLKHFVKAAWNVIEPSPLIWNWHMQVLCDALQATLLHTGPQNLLINVPPGTSKSLLTSVFAPAWMWLHNPTWRAIYAAGDYDISIRDSIKCRDLIGSEWYRDTFRPSWRLSDDQNVKELFKNTAMGWRKATSVEKKITGGRADALFLDDPLDANEAHSKVKRDGIINWMDQAWGNRLNDMQTGTRVIIMQRLHEEDPAGHVLAQGGYSVLCLPMSYDPGHPHVSKSDQRTTEGALLFPERFPQSVLDYEMLRLGSAGYAGQMEQRPMPAGGGMFRAEWFRFYRLKESDPKVQWRPKGCSTADSVVLPDDFDEVATSWDMNFKKATDDDFVAGGLWARRGANKFMTARFYERVGFLGALKAVKAMALVQVRKRKPRQHLVEDKANGSAIVETLQDQISGILAVEPEGGKDSRAAAIAPQVEAGQVYLPDGAPWLEEYIGNMCGFPRAKHDDDVDQTSQVLIRMAESSTSFASRFAEAHREGRLDNVIGFPVMSR